MEYCGPSGLFAYPTVQTSSGAIASIPWRVLSTTIDGDADATLGLGTNAQFPAGPGDGGFDAPPAAVQVPWAVADGVPQSSLDCTVNRIASSSGFALRARSRPRT